MTCSDETEREIVESFQHWFAEPLLPELKYWSRSVFRSANLGGRYEWGAIRIADEHYDNPDLRDGQRVLAIKLNPHVAVDRSGTTPAFGKLDRYSRKSSCCGAIHALLDGVRHPAMDEPRDAFRYDDRDRLAMLLDPQVVAPEFRSFVAAVVNARLQARSAIVDIQNYAPELPTYFIVLPRVTLNRSHRDTEFVVGMYWADSREGIGKAHYVGPGDDPSAYRISHHRMLAIEDNHLKQPREARDHRHEVVTEWRARHADVPAVDDARLQQVVREVRANAAPSASMAQETLKTLLWIAADAAPVPLSMLLFAKGLAGVHHLYQVHRLARGTAEPEQALDIIEEVADQVNKYTAEQSISAVHAIMDVTV